MKTRGILWISISILIFALFSVWLRLPMVSNDIWMSPDETANIVSAINFADTGSFSFNSEITQKFIWAHPRSFVFVPETNMVAPIGFLGMPFILSFIYKFFGLLGVNFFAPLLALITLFPLWRLMPKTWSSPVKLMSIIIWMSLPTIILYTNRGAFPQLTQLCLIVWTWFLITLPLQTKTRAWLNKIHLPVAGSLSAIALMIRPVEAIWILPVIVFAFLYKYNNTTQQSKVSIRNLVLFLVPFVFFLIIGAKLGADTYGKWFVSGYQIRPEVTQISEVDKIATSATVSFFDTLPFGFHPRNIWWNFKNYYGGLLFPWSILLFGSLLILYKEKFWKNDYLWPIIAMAWSAAVLIIFYGNGIYQDHVRLNEISIGNSFLRYTLPLTIPIALSAGFIFARLWKHWSLKILAICLTVGLSTYGIWIANGSSDESLISAEQELISYSNVRKAAAKHFPESGIVISDRSDKIFFPKYFAISPMPSTEQLIELTLEGIDIRLYLPTQDDAGIEKWRKNGFNLRSVFTTGNQTLYDVY
jgi:hypothetical protein